jgi:6-phosphogluconolactonase
VLEVEDRIAAEVYVPRLDGWRVTLTRPVLRAAALRLVLATGAKKKSILEGIRDGADYPIAQVTRDVETWWLIDHEAAP